MNEEWYQPTEWSEPPQEFDQPAADFLLASCEMAPLQEELVTPAEFGAEEAPAEEPQGFFAPNKKRMRKLLYGLTSMAMVVSLGGSLAGAPAGEMSAQPVWFSVYNSHADYAQNGILAVGGADSIWGVGHVDYDYRRVDYSGNPLAAENEHSYGYNGKWVNEGGYALTYGHNAYAVYAPDGRLMYEWTKEDFPDSSVREAAISNDNVVFFRLEVRTENGSIDRCVYYSLRGKKLCSIDCDKSISTNGMARIGTPMRSGAAVCNDGTGILLVQPNGKTRRLAEWPQADASAQRMDDAFAVERSGILTASDGRYTLANVPCLVSGGVSYGYYLVTDTAGTLALVELETGTMYPVEWHYGGTDVEEISGGHYVAYSDNEGEMIHRGTLLCAVEKDANKETKYYLFDVTRHCNAEGERTGYIACYDAIWFEDDTQLLVRQGEEYFYIDLDGNVISESYQKATTFSDCGYALVQTASGAVYVIDRQFNRLERLPNVDDFSIKDIGEVFWVTCDEQPYCYYYGPEMQ